MNVTVVLQDKWLLLLYRPALWTLLVVALTHLFHVFLAFQTLCFLDHVASAELCSDTFGNAFGVLVPDSVSAGLSWSYAPLTGGHSAAAVPADF